MYIHVDSGVLADTYRKVAWVDRLWVVSASWSG
jgi:hypothetical protein